MRRRFGGRKRYGYGKRRGFKKRGFKKSVRGIRIGYRF